MPLLNLQKIGDLSKITKYTKKAQKSAFFNQFIKIFSIMKKGYSSKS